MDITVWSVTEKFAVNIIRARKFSSMNRIGDEMETNITAAIDAICCEWEWASCSLTKRWASMCIETAIIVKITFTHTAHTHTHACNQCECEWECYLIYSITTLELVFFYDAGWLWCIKRTHRVSLCIMRRTMSHDYSFISKLSLNKKWKNFIWCAFSLAKSSMSAMLCWEQIERVLLEERRRKAIYYY